MGESKIYDFPGGVCPACEYHPLKVEVGSNDYGASFVWFVCPSCGNKEMLPQTKNTDATSRNNKLQTEWARRVKDRDGNACFICGEISNTDAHHLISASDFPELQNKLSNGITLCRRCHRLVHDHTRRWPEKYK